MKLSMDDRGGLTFRVISQGAANFGLGLNLAILTACEAQLVSGHPGLTVDGLKTPTMLPFRALLLSWLAGLSLGHKSNAWTIAARPPNSLALREIRYDGIGLEIWILSLNF